jgi:lysine 2,3-aminomutase
MCRSRNKAAAAGSPHAFRVTPAVRATIRGGADDPVARQYLFDARELHTRADELEDPIGDAAHSPVPGIVHRYPDRALLMPVQSCAAYCRYCFRRESVGTGKNILAPEKLEAALAYIAGTPALREIILSGGDPLVLSARRMAALLQRLAAIPHLDVLRIHTRVPLADPARVTPALCRALARCEKPVYVVLHVNHAQELSQEAEAAIRRLHRAGCVLLSQSVLLRGVNDDADTLAALLRRLVALKVKPYYLHHPDRAPGTAHFRVSIARGQEIVRQLRGRVSGLCQPTYMLDIPGGHGKVPLTPCHLDGDAQSGYVIEDIHGRSHAYRDSDS